MRDPLRVAEELLKIAIAREPDEPILGDVTAGELAALAASKVITCPKCGAEAWVDIDCDLCLVCSQLVRGEIP